MSKETEQFITENMKLVSESDAVEKKDDKTGKVTRKASSAVFQVNQVPFKKFMASKGINSDTYDLFQEVELDYRDSCAHVAAKKAVELEKDKVEVRTRQPHYRTDAVLNKKRVTCNKMTDYKEVVKYGGLSFKIDGRIFSKDCVESISAEIEKAIA